MRTPCLSLVVLTWNEADNIEACLAALARQKVFGDASAFVCGVGFGANSGDESGVDSGVASRDPIPFEVVVIDAGSSDATVAKVEQMQALLPFPVTLRVGPPRMPIGAARNLGVALSQAPLVAFLSADAQLHEDWVGQALQTLRTADMAFGPQVHAPHRWTLGAAVRGLRYQFPDAPTATPLRFASNVAAAYRKPVLQEFPFDPWANAAEDLLLAHRAAAAGYIAAYNPHMKVKHHDVASLRQELRKNLREGRGCGLYAKELGVQWPVLAWSGLLVASGLILVTSTTLGLVALAGALWLPAARRGVRRRRVMPARHLWAGMAAAPVFDLAFLVQYLRGLLGARLRTPSSQSLETNP